jgi:regulator of RNase E activity RraB
MTELLVGLGLMAGVVGASISLVQLMHWSEQKRAELLRRTVMQAFREGYDVRKSEEMQ